MMVMLICLIASAAEMTMDEFIKKVKSDCKALQEERISLEKQRSENTRGLAQTNDTTIPDYAKTESQAAVDQQEEMVRSLSTVIRQAQTMINEIDTTSDPAEKRSKAKMAAVLLATGKFLILPSLNIRANLKSLEYVASESMRAVVINGIENKSATADVFSNKMGGGIFIDKTAQIPAIDRSNVTRAYYDLGRKCFIIDEGGRNWVLPRMDTDIVAVVINCLYNPSESNREIAVSLGIDPVNAGRITTSLPGYVKVLFGCSRLTDTNVGRILIDADDLIESLWYGLSRNGVVLTHKLGYPSLLQMTLDHPVNESIALNTPVSKRDMNMRVWINPQPIRLTSSTGRQLQFESVSFRMFSETVRVDSKNTFSGEVVQNPGADSFTQYFSSHIDKFVDTPLRREPASGVVIKPLRELQELARIVAVIRWIKGDGLDVNEIPMDITWAAKYPIRYVPTDRHIPVLEWHDVYKSTKGPMVIYNEYGASRIIDEEGNIVQIIYENGHIRKLIHPDISINIP